MVNETATPPRVVRFIARARSANTGKRQHESTYDPEVDVLRILFRDVKPPDLPQLFHCVGCLAWSRSENGVPGILPFVKSLRNRREGRGCGAEFRTISGELARAPLAAQGMWLNGMLSRQR